MTSALEQGAIKGQSLEAGLCGSRKRKGHMQNEPGGLVQKVTRTDIDTNRMREDVGKTANKMKQNAEKVVYECQICEAKKNSIETLVKHMEIHRISGKLCCPVCEQIIVYTSSFIAHMVKHEILNKAWKCSLCQRIFTADKGLMRHVRLHTKETTRCKECGLMVNDEADLVKHQKVHDQLYIDRTHTYKSKRLSKKQVPVIAACDEVPDIATCDKVPDIAACDKVPDIAACNEVPDIAACNERDRNQTDKNRYYNLQLKLHDFRKCTCIDNSIKNGYDHITKTVYVGSSTHQNSLVTKTGRKGYQNKEIIVPETSKKGFKDQKSVVTETSKSGFKDEGNVVNDISKKGYKEQENVVTHTSKKRYKEQEDVVTDTGKKEYKDQKSIVSDISKEGYKNQEIVLTDTGKKAYKDQENVTETNKEGYKDQENVLSDISKKGFKDQESIVSDISKKGYKDQEDVVADTSKKGFKDQEDVVADTSKRGCKDQENVVIDTSKKGYKGQETDTSKKEYKDQERIVIDSSKKGYKDEESIVIDTSKKGYKDQEDVVADTSKEGCKYQENVVIGTSKKEYKGQETDTSKKENKDQEIIVSDTSQKGYKDEESIVIDISKKGFKDQESILIEKKGESCKYQEHTSIENNDESVANNINISIHKSQESITTTNEEARTKTEKMTHKCAKCGKKFHSIQEAKSHLRQFHKLKFRVQLVNQIDPKLVANFVDVLYKCDFCQQKFTSKTMLSQHMDIHVQKEGVDSVARVYTCKECNMTFKRHAALVFHESMHDQSSHDEPDSSQDDSDGNHVEADGNQDEANWDVSDGNRDESAGNRDEPVFLDTDYDDSHVERISSHESTSQNGVTHDVKHGSTDASGGDIVFEADNAISDRESTSQFDKSEAKKQLTREVDTTTIARTDGNTTTIARTDGNTGFYKMAGNKRQFNRKFGNNKFGRQIANMKMFTKKIQKLKQSKNIFDRTSHFVKKCERKGCLLPNCTKMKHRKKIVIIKSNTTTICIYCKQQFKNVYSLVSHMKNHKGKYTCPKCGKKIDFIRALKKHMKQCTGTHQSRTKPIKVQVFCYPSFGTVKDRTLKCHSSCGSVNFVNQKSENVSFNP